MEACGINFFYLRAVFPLTLMFVTASAQVCVPLGHSSLYFCKIWHAKPTIEDGRKVFYGPGHCLLNSCEWYRKTQWVTEPFRLQTDLPLVREARLSLRSPLNQWQNFTFCPSAVENSTLGLLPPARSSARFSVKYVGGPEDLCGQKVKSYKTGYCLI